MFESRKKREKIAATMTGAEFLDWSIKQGRREVVFWSCLYWGIGGGLILAFIVASALERS